MIWLLVFTATFLAMEWVAWFVHKYVMHGFLWSLHEDHHTPSPHRKWQKNDVFAMVFAMPSFLLILNDHLHDSPLSAAMGFGIMAYGLAYFFVHEIIIHRRWKLLRVKNNRYFRWVNSAHKIHHSRKSKDGCKNFGMLLLIGGRW